MKKFDITFRGEVLPRHDPERVKAGFMDLFKIRDTGIGISPSQRHEIFEDFAQGDARSAREHGGSGLGLSISRRLVELMGGELELAESAERGSVFRFSACLKEVGEGMNPGIDDQLLDSMRILVADPNPTWQEILERADFLDIVL